MKNGYNNNNKNIIESNKDINLLRFCKLLYFPQNRIKNMLI